MSITYLRDYLYVKETLDNYTDVIIPIIEKPEDLSNPPNKVELPDNFTSNLVYATVFLLGVAGIIAILSISEVYSPGLTK